MGDRHSSNVERTMVVFHLHWTLLFLMVAIGQALDSMRSIEDQTFGEADSKEVDEYDVTYDVKMTDFEQFLEANLNHDGKVSIEEIKAYNLNFIKEDFNEYDKNQDGIIDLNETKQASDEDYAAPRVIETTMCDFEPDAYCWRGGHCERCEFPKVHKPM